MKSHVLLVACSLLAACSGVAPSGTGNLGADGGAPAAASSAPPAGSPSGTSPSSGGTSGPPSSPADAGTAAPPTPPPVDDDAGTKGPPDDASAPPPPSTGVFGGAGAYAPTLGPSSDNPKHPTTPNPAGLACLGCHGGQKPNITRFLYAGTVWQGAAATAPAAQAEVRIVEANGAARSAYADTNGNFFFLAGADSLAPPASAGVRDGQGAALMTNVINDGDCNSCHRAGGEAPLHAP